MLDIKNENFEIPTRPSISNIKLEPINHLDAENQSPPPCTSKSADHKIKKEISDVGLKIKSEIIIKPHEQCPICLSLMKNQLLARPIDCKHSFCLECIEEWSRKTNTCPIDRKPFNYIIVSNPLDKNFTEKKKIEDKTLENNEVTDFTYCEVCGACDREDTLLLCDGCDRGYHCECLNPPLERVPEEEWFCLNCTGLRNQSNTTREGDESANENNFNRIRARARNGRPIARTNLIERVRRVINNSRFHSSNNLTQSESNIIATQILLHNYSSGRRVSTVTSVKPAKRKRTVKRRKVTKRRKVRKRKKTTKSVLIKQEDGSFKSYQIKSKITTRKKRKVKKKKVRKNKVGITKPYAHMKKDDQIFLQTNRKMELTSDILLPNNDNGLYENFYSEFADLPSKRLTKEVSNEKVKVESKTVPDTTNSSNALVQTNSISLLDSIFSSQNMLFKSSQKVEIQKNGVIALKKDTESEKKASEVVLKKESDTFTLGNKTTIAKTASVNNFINNMVFKTEKEIKSSRHSKSKPKIDDQYQQTFTKTNKFKIPKIKMEGSHENLKSEIQMDPTNEDSTTSKKTQNFQKIISNKIEIHERIKKIEEIAKVELKGFFRNKSIDKDQYKMIMKKIVGKLAMGPDEEINLRKIKKMVTYYIEKVKNNKLF